jgi:hypothetical protein
MMLAIDSPHGTISAKTAINLTEEVAPGCFGTVAASKEMTSE